MKFDKSHALAALAGIALGATAIQGLHAQAKPSVYVVVDINEVTDAAAQAANAQRTAAEAAKTLKEFGGRYMARTDKVTALDGVPPKRSVIIAFDSVEKAQGWYGSPVQKEVNAVRLKSTKSRAFIVDGL